MPESLQPHQPPVSFTPYVPDPFRKEFRILDHVKPTRRYGRNYVAQCPSCASAGRDRSRDNLAILVKDPRFYQCFAGCDKYMIREALGCPVPRGFSARTS
jgi:hypothetical protein